MNPAANHCPLPKFAVWRFLSLHFHRNTAFPKYRNTSSIPHFPGPATGSFKDLHTKSNFLTSNLVLAALSAGLGFGFSQSAMAADSKHTEPLPAAQANETAATPIPFSELGAKATADCKGAGTGIEATPEGARLHTDFQKLRGAVSREGLWLDSTEQGGGRLRMITTEVGRIDSQLSSINSQRLPMTGSVVVSEKTVAFTRPGIVEEYSVSVDGVRQDFIINECPAGAGRLQVELALSGARAESVVAGAKLILNDSGRELAYSRLHVVDAKGRELPATLEVLAHDRLAVRVDDASATYPVRIDPTFSDADWVSMNPGIPGADSYVRAMAVDGNGNLYIGGEFTFVGTIAANHVAKWNGSIWSALGTGVSGDWNYYANPHVNALAVIGGDLYVGGFFTHAGGVSANNIAKWNGSSWSALGSGTAGGWYPTVYAFAANGNDLYVGGSFATTGGLAASGIAKWDGNAWSSLGAGMTKDNSYEWSVRNIAMNGTVLYAAGDFTTAGGLPAKNIAKWDGSTWSALGSGIDNVGALAVMGGDLYLAGSFTTIGGVAANNIAKWNGNTWSALGSGIDCYAYGCVYALAVNGGDLYAGGYFYRAGGLYTRNIAKWNGSAWSTVGTGISKVSTCSYGVYTLLASGSLLYAGGNFDSAGGVNANFIAKWNGGVWSALGPHGMTAGVRALAVSGCSLYVGGSFSTTPDGDKANGIAKWDGSTWTALGSGLGRGGALPEVYALVINGSDLYAAGYFSTAGGIVANNIAKWNGSMWSALGSGINNQVNALAVNGSDLYAGGWFTSAGDVAASYIAKWNGSTWSPLASGTNDCVQALAVKDSELFAGGWFTTAGGVATNNIAKWDGNAWSSLGSGIDSGVYALAVSGSDLYAGGDFTSAGGVTANNIAKWNGSAWSALGAGLDSEVDALAMRGTDLYAGGWFETAGGVAASHIAKWNGSAWSALGSGMDGVVEALAINASDQIFIGGYFSFAGRTLSPYLAQANLVGTGATSNLETWRQNHFGIIDDRGDAADMADPDKDGISNLLEFAFGLNPKLNSAGLLPTPQKSGDNYVVSFTQPAGVSGITYGAEWSATLLAGSWTAVADTGNTGASPPQHTFSVPVGTQTKLFMRLKVTNP